MKTPKQQVEDNLQTIREEYGNQPLGHHDVSIREDRAIIDTKVSNDCENHQQITWLVYGENLTHPQLAGLIFETEL
ncbi:hypothetical protein [Haladaptatus sp. R4]|uniref:hypothetical protein n=1 Tax=Haladaptatus sp. R4 TaxID=1679489 RepID=UPI000A759CFD|nr:hypothetical protein [Haladaptatus sp. R4]